MSSVMMYADERESDSLLVRYLYFEIAIDINLWTFDSFNSLLLWSGFTDGMNSMNYSE